MTAYKEWVLTKAGNWRSPKVRLSYANTLIVPKAFEEGKNALYGCTLLHPKSIKVDAFRDAIKELAGKTFGDKTKGLKVPLLDGDAEQNFRPETEGMWIIRANGGTQKPRIFDAKLQPVDDDREIYSGRWASVSLRLSSFNKQVNKGISAYIQNIVLLDHDEPLGGAPARVEDEFEPVGSDKEDMFG
jgi:hypothetical protein